MSTHGVFVIKMDNVIWGFHLTHDGQDMKIFYNDNKKITDKDIIFENAINEFSFEGYTDNPSVNIYKEKFDKEKDYTRITYYTCYFDGKKWFSNWDERK